MPPTPNPNPTSTQTLNATVAVKLTTSSGKTFNAKTGLIDYTAVETDTYSTPPETETATTDEYVLLTGTMASGTISNVGTTVSTSTGATYTTDYGTGNGLLENLPYATGPITPANNAALTKTEVDADGTQTVRTVNADGSYTQNETIPGGLTATAIESANGSGSYSYPLLDYTPNTTIAVGVASAGSIPLTVTYGPIPGAPVGPQSRPVPDWYPATPPVLSQETYTDNGVTSLPSGCSVSGSLPHSGRNLTQTITTVDTIFGETETRTANSYIANGIGLLCMKLSDVVASYYDYSGQAFNVPALYGTPYQTTTIAETVYATSASSAGVFGTSATGVSLPGDVAPLSGTVAARFNALVERERNARHAAAFSKLRSASGRIVR